MTNNPKHIYCNNCGKRFPSLPPTYSLSCKHCTSKANIDAGNTIEEWFGPADASMVYPVTDPDKYKDGTK